MNTPINVQMARRATPKIVIERPSVRGASQ
jgi:hypothetical protein